MSSSTRLEESAASTRGGGPRSLASTSGVAATVHASVGRGSRRRSLGADWEILGSLEEGVAYSIRPKRQEGFLSKKRKWPLKGWHKR